MHRIELTLEPDEGGRFDFRQAYDLCNVCDVEMDILVAARVNIDGPAVSKVEGLTLYPATQIVDDAGRSHTAGCPFLSSTVPGTTSGVYFWSLPGGARIARVAQGGAQTLLHDWESEVDFSTASVAGFTLPQTWQSGEWAHDPSGHAFSRSKVCAGSTGDGDFGVRVEPVALPDPVREYLGNLDQ